nr:AarF/ABC1/UbiB kinase family protein [Pseudenhygromyxa sp. WMMC2535]
MRVDVFSKEFCNELTELQDRVSAFDTATARKIIEAQIGAPITAAFANFKDEPIGAASLAQVHKAQFHDGTLVAIKVLRPNADRLFQIDFAWLRAWFSLLDRLDLGRSFNWLEMLQEVHTLIEEELDYSHELAAIEQMRVTLAAHGIYVPKPFPEYSGRRVLVMEFIPGVTIAEYIRMQRVDPARAEAWLDENDIDRREVARVLCSSLLRQMFEDNVCHGDLHPGNIMLLRDSRVALLDFGTVGSFDAEFTSVYRLYLTAIAMGNIGEAADLMLWISKPLPPDIEINRVRREIMTSLRNWRARTRQTSIGVEKRSLSSSSEEIGQIMIKYGFESNWSILKLGRTYSTLDMTLNAIYPEVNYPDLLEGYYRGFIRRRIKSSIKDLATLPLRIMDYAPLFLPQLRASSFEYSRPKPSSAQVFVQWLLRHARLLLTSAAIFMLAVYYAQHRPATWSRLFSPEGAVSGLVERVPSTSPALCLILGLVALYLAWSAHRAIRKR